MREKKRISIIGFNANKPDIKFHHCQIHQGSRLIPYTQEEGYYYCTECGVPYNPSNTKSDTHITSRFSTIEGQKKIVSGRSRGQKDKEYYDLSGTKLPNNDPDIMRDIAEGHTIISYHTTEQIDNKEKEFTYVKKR